MPAAAVERSSAVGRDQKVAIEAMTPAVAMLKAVSPALVHKSGEQSKEVVPSLFQAMRCDFGIPRFVMRFMTEQATRTSVFCTAKLRARNVGPIRVL